MRLVAMAGCPMCGSVLVNTAWAIERSLYERVPKAQAEFYCSSRYCLATMKVEQAGQDAPIFVKAFDDAERARAAFRESVGGFQFTD